MYSNRRCNISHLAMSPLIITSVNRWRIPYCQEHNRVSITICIVNMEITTKHIGGELHMIVNILLDKLSA
jgi:hypothetical protein